MFDPTFRWDNYGLKDRHLQEKWQLEKIFSKNGYVRACTALRLFLVGSWVTNPQKNYRLLSITCLNPVFFSQRAARLTLSRLSAATWIEALGFHHVHPFTCGIHGLHGMFLEPWGGGNANEKNPDKNEKSQDFNTSIRKLQYIDVSDTFDKEILCIPLVEDSFFCMPVHKRSIFGLPYLW